MPVLIDFPEGLSESLWEYGCVDASTTIRRYLEATADIEGYWNKVRTTVYRRMSLYSVLETMLFLQIE